MIPTSLLLIEQRLVIQDQTFGRSPFQRGDAGIKRSYVNFKLMSVRIEEIKGFSLAVVLLPLLDSRCDDAFTQRYKIRSGNREGDVIVCFILSSICELSFEREAYPEVACQKVGSLVPTRYRAKSEKLHIKAESTIQIAHRKRDVIQAVDHTPEPITGRWLDSGREAA